MPKKHKLPVEPDHEPVRSESENYLENSKYMKMLKLQRSVLNKLVKADSKNPAHNPDIDNENPESN